MKIENIRQEAKRKADEGMPALLASLLTPNCAYAEQHDKLLECEEALYLWHHDGEMKPFLIQAREHNLNLLSALRPCCVCIGCLRRRSMEVHRNVHW